MLNYWKNYWNSISILDGLQNQVGRRHKKEPIQDDIFKKTLGFIEDNMQFTMDSVLLDLCCGNGLLSIPFSKKVRKVTAVDFSEPLLKVLKNGIEDQHIQNIEIMYGDINTMTFPQEKYSHILIYFALQHFSEQETIFLFEKAYQCLQPNGIFYLGDIPDRSKLWDFANTDEYVNMYFDSVKNATPAIGNWFLSEDLSKLAHYTGFSNCEIIVQPNYQINSRWRFDVKLIK
ncbi:MAG: class I SAM-dependent methyltransferase [Bacteroidales bacterium]|jgi:ubiquinone/menaquinone biosynthesis C-methylase UbiE|nr:class I SAM-dependent methyltransferase [Bacteroidales bacterium]